MWQACSNTAPAPATQSEAHLDRSVQRGAGKLVVVLGVDDNLHDVVRVSFEHLRARPLLVPVPELDEHVI